MDDAHAWIELHFADEPEEAAALRRIIAGVPACRAGILRLLADRTPATYLPAEPDATPARWTQ